MVLVITAAVQDRANKGDRQDLNLQKSLIQPVHIRLQCRLFLIILLRQNDGKNAGQ